MEIHQGKHNSVQNRQHGCHWFETHATAILSQCHIATPVETIFNGIITNDKCDTRLHDLSEAKAFRQVSMPVPNPSLRHWQR